MKPIHYNIHLEPDLEKFTFDGKVTIEVQADEPVHEVCLNARDLEIKRCSLLVNDRTQDCEFSYLPERQELCISLPETVQGVISLSIVYAVEINQQYAGFYRSRYYYNGEEKYIASTQFEAKEARRAFPCFDEPALKATFDIEYIIDANLTGVANTAILEESPLNDGRKLVRFERTPRMSTYLVFFGVGEFDSIEDDSRPPRIRVLTTPGNSQFGEFALQIARESLNFGEEYTGVPYPLSKCDYLAIPDSMGAMENFGAIRHAEDVMLVYPDVTPKSRRILIAKIIAHESIHMWFGDLVSPASWKYLWLNEAFATYFTYVIPHYYYPHWGVWEQFFVERMLSGMERDSLNGSVPIDLPGVDDPDADPSPTPSTAPIVYNKGAAVIRMLSSYLGEELFKKAIHEFLEQYQFDAATSEQFWTSVEDTSGAAVKAFAHTWVNQAGYPLVEAKRSGDALVLTQKKFSYNAADNDKTWVIPVGIAFYREDGQMQKRQLILDAQQGMIEIPESFTGYKVNADFSGFYRVNYPRENWDNLGDLIRTKKLSAVDTLNILSDLFAMVKAGEYSADEYLDFIEKYCSAEDRFLPLTELARSLMNLYLTSEIARERIAQFGAAHFESVLERIGYQPRPEESVLTTELRGTLLISAFYLGSEKVRTFGLDAFQKLLNGETIDEDILASVLKISAGAQPSAADYLVKIANSTDASDAERAQALEALGFLQDEAQLRDALQMNLEKIPQSLRMNMLMTASRNPAANRFLWSWFVEHLEQLAVPPIQRLEGLIVRLVPVCGLGHEEDVQRVLRGIVTQHPQTADSVQMALELLQVNTHLQEN